MPVDEVRPMEVDVAVTKVMTVAEMASTAVEMASTAMEAPKSAATPTMDLDDQII